MKLLDESANVASSLLATSGAVPTLPESCDTVDRKLLLITKGAGSYVLIVSL
jgi:hypothetical protein